MNLTTSVAGKNFNFLKESSRSIKMTTSVAYVLNEEITKVVLKTAEVGNSHLTFTKGSPRKLHLA